MTYSIFTALIIASLGSSLFALTPEEGKVFTAPITRGVRVGGKLIIVALASLA